MRMTHPNLLKKNVLFYYIIELENILRQIYGTIAL